MNGFLHNGAGYLWTDTSMFEGATGRPIGHMEKAFYGTDWPWAAVHSGMLDPENMHRPKWRIAEIGPKNPDELLAAAVDALLYETSAGYPDGRLLICCGCPAQGARLWIVAADRHLPFAQPYVPTEIGGMVSSGIGSEEYQRLVEGGVTPKKVRRYIDYQARSPTKTMVGFEGLTIGGNILEVKVTADGVDVREIRQGVGSFV